MVASYVHVSFQLKSERSNRLGKNEAEGNSEKGVRKENTRER